MSGQGGGVAHWRNQRISSLLLIPLTAWLLWAIVALSGADHPAAVVFLGSPFNAAMAILTAGVMVYHAQSGITVVCEDYVPPALQTALIGLTRLGCLVGFLATVYTVITVWQGA